MAGPVGTSRENTEDNAQEENRPTVMQAAPTSVATAIIGARESVQWRAIAAGIVLLAQCSAWSPVLGLFENLGRMALTIYLSGTLMFTTLFYGYGFGQFNLIGPTGVFVYAVLFFALQMAFCALWLKQFRYGPIEWVWRSLTYLKVQPLKV